MKKIYHFYKFFYVTLLTLFGAVLLLVPAAMARDAFAGAGMDGDGEEECMLAGLKISGENRIEYETLIINFNEKNFQMPAKKKLHNYLQAERDRRS